MCIVQVDCQLASTAGTTVQQPVHSCTGGSFSVAIGNVLTSSLLQAGYQTADEAVCGSVQQMQRT